ncbi:MAG TPA: CoA ester lyase [Candidatus Bathyarchaeia archaeon]|nr:CoA ester lyase [Candidatus Bathyarchaeia archaeon]
MIPPRSLLYMPASRREFLDKVPGSAADVVIVDLEDAVAPGEKDLARDNVRAAARAGTLRHEAPWMLRLNNGPTGPPPEDLILVGFAKPAWVVLPKVEDAGTTGALVARIAEHGARVALTIESARGVAHVRELAGCHPAVGMLILGSADLRLSLGAPEEPERAWERHAMAELLVAARCHGACAIDSVWFRYTDDEGLRRHAAVARGIGFDGKSCIHPRQVEIVHEVFAPTREEIRWAERVQEAWAKGDGAARGVVGMDGEMIEALHVTLAERILRRVTR